MQDYAQFLRYPATPPVRQVDPNFATLALLRYQIHVTTAALEEEASLCEALRYTHELLKRESRQKE